jgi:hypothetical protein
MDDGKSVVRGLNGKVSDDRDYETKGSDIKASAAKELNERRLQDNKPESESEKSIENLGRAKH